MRGAERGDPQPPRAACGARVRRRALPHPLRHRGAAAPLPARGPGVRGPLAGHVRPGAVGPARAPAAAGPRPLRHQTALLRPRRRPPGVRLGAEGAHAPAVVLARARLGRAPLLPRVQLHSGAADDLPPGPQTARGPPARLRSSRRNHQPLRPPHPGRAGRSAAGARRGPGRGAARAAARVGRGPSAGGRAGRRAALGRGGLVPARRARLGELGHARLHILDRLQGAELQRARAGARFSRTLRHRAPRAGRLPRRRRAAAQDRRGLRRAVRRLLGDTHLSGLGARGAPRQGGALRRGRRRALRRV